MSEAPDAVRQVRQAERWGVAEIPLPGAGPHPEVVFRHGRRSAHGQLGEHRLTALPFTDEAGRGVVRFLPDEEGEWRYDAGFGERTLHCVPPAPGNHGPVRADGLGFRHADGRPFHPVSTTLTEVTPAALRALADGPFNRVRLLTGPKTPPARVEEQVRGLLELGIEAEVPLHDLAGVAATVPRLAAYRNVWWCAPPDREVQDAVRELDYGHHPLTVHGDVRTDFGAPWLSHASVRHEETRNVGVLVADLCKPVIVDDCGAEGDAADPRDSLPAAELVSRVWEGVCQGGYATHREAYEGEQPLGPRGGSAPRLAFLRQVLDDAPEGLRYDPTVYDASTLRVPGAYLLQYLGAHRFPSRPLALGEGTWDVEVLDVWAMTVVERSRVASTGTVEVPLPADPYHAIRARRVPGA